MHVGSEDVSNDSELSNFIPCCDCNKTTVSTCCNQYWFCSENLVGQVNKYLYFNLILKVFPPVWGHSSDLYTVLPKLVTRATAAQAVA